MSEQCEFCNETYYREDDTPSEQYMWEGHIIVECTDVPKEIRDDINEPNLAQ